MKPSASLTEKYVRRGQFYSKSRLKPEDFGHGPMDPAWPRMFSNFWGTSFTLDDCTWCSVEAYYHYMRYQLLYRTHKGKNPTFDTYVCQAQQQLKQLNQKLLKDLPTMNVKQKSEVGLACKKLNNQLYAQLPPVVDISHFINCWNQYYAVQCMKKAITAKFEQNPDLRQQLLKTGQQRLSHHARFVPSRALTSDYSNYRWGEMITTAGKLRSWKGNVEPRYSTLLPSVAWQSYTEVPPHTPLVVGLNKMAKILMEVREELKSDKN